MAVDETSYRRGHRYITLFVDVDTKMILFATEGKGMDTLVCFKVFLVGKGRDTAQVEEVCCDMSPAYIRGIQDYFPQVQISFDKFHIMKLINEAFDDVRITEQKQHPALNKSKYIWLKNGNKLNEEQKNTLERLRDGNLQTGRAYRLKLALQEFWHLRHIFADMYLQEWIGWATRSQITTDGTSGQDNETT
ncbi:transposase [Marinicrinis sediminis]|uniref:Transposase n=1 Tax=Marinicrinis sediminis TaxID=1652465 RepID=A0ABW5RAQ9_9BACL